MTTTKQYDFLNRLQSISSSTNSSTAPSSAAASAYNDANQRTKLVQADGSYWLYQYDSLGQVVSGKRYWPHETPIAGQQFEYAFDGIGKRSSTDAGGNSMGAILRVANY